MTTDKNAEEKLSAAGIKVGLSGVLLVLFIIICFWLIFKFAEKERNRDLMNWQSRLALLAEIRAADIEDLIDKRKAQLHKLSANSSLSLFLSQFANKEEFDESVLRAQQGHVRNLIRASAEQFGFAEPVNSVQSIKMNNSGEYGLAILGAQQQLLMASKGFPEDIERHRYIIDKVYKNATSEIIDLYAGRQRWPVYGYISPVFHIQDSKHKVPVGAVMVLLNPQKTLYKILQNRQNITSSDETLLVKRTAASLEYISPLKGDYKLFHKLPDNNNQLASSYAYHNPGGFAQMKDYRGNDVLVTGRKLKNSSWRLVQKISAAEALADSNQHQKFLITTFSLFVLIIAFAFVAIWRHSTGVRLQALSHSLETHIALLDAVTDNIKENIFLLDEGFKIIFINPAFAMLMNADFKELKNRHLLSVLGKEAEVLLTHALDSEGHASVIPLSVNGENRLYHVSSTRLKTGEYKNSILYVMHDISELKREQEKRENLNRGIISTLVKAVDLHDPYCANHSERTREVAMEIAKEMGLPAERLESLEMASLLANIGKLFVPKEILTKMGELTEDESQQLKKHIEYAVEILGEITFNGPVVDIISQKNERLDGTGYPEGLSDNEILLESKILSVANAFVAMVSSRAYRKGREVNEVVDVLIQQAESQYDRHVVAALFHIAENKADWKGWKNISDTL